MNNAPTHRIPKKVPTHCDDCNVLLTKDNMSKRLGVIKKHCRKCLSKKVAKYNEKRKKALKDTKWF